MSEEQQEKPPVSTANSTQVGGDHYKSEFQHWDWALSMQMEYLPAQITKYLTRWRKKNGIQDLKKAAHFLDKYIESEAERHKLRVLTTNEFLKANIIDEVSAAIIVSILRYRDSEPSHLMTAKVIIAKLIEGAEAANSSATVADNEAKTEAGSAAA